MLNDRKIIEMAMRYLQDKLLSISDKLNESINDDMRQMLKDEYLKYLREYDELMNLLLCIQIRKVLNICNETSKNDSKAEKKLNMKSNNQTPKYFISRGGVHGSCDFKKRGDKKNMERINYLLNHVTNNDSNLKNLLLDFLLGKNLPNNTKILSIIGGPATGKTMLYKVFKMLKDRGYLDNVELVHDDIYLPEDDFMPDSFTKKMVRKSREMICEMIEISKDKNAIFFHNESLKEILKRENQDPNICFEIEIQNPIKLTKEQYHSTLSEEEVLSFIENIQ